MALTIGPVGDESDRRRLLLSHGLGLLGGALSMALVLTLLAALLNAVLPTSSSSMSAAAAIGGVVVLIGWTLSSAGIAGLPYPKSRWQVPESWRRVLPAQFALGLYGYLLGLGFLTNVVLPPFWILIAGTVIANDIFLALGSWASYALVRLLLTAYATQRAVAEQDSLEVIDLRGPGRLVFLRIGTVLLLLSSAVTLLLHGLSM